MIDIDWATQTIGYPPCRQRAMERARGRFPGAGDKVRFIGRNGYDFELVQAMIEFEVGEIVTVAKTCIGGFKSSYRFEGRNDSFNTVMFELVERKAAA